MLEKLTKQTKNYERGFASILTVLILLLVLGGALYIYHKSSSVQNKSTGSGESANNSSLMPKEVPATLPLTSPSPQGTQTDQISQVQALQSEVSALQVQVNALKVQPTKSSLPNTDVYIPLGNVDPLNDTNWRTLDAQSIYINPADYPGYSSMQLELSMRLNAGGNASAQLYDAIDQSAIASSKVTTNSTLFVPLVSSKFNLSAGKKLYKLQAMDDSGDTFFIQAVRIKVNF